MDTLLAFIELPRMVSNAVEAGSDNQIMKNGLWYNLILLRPVMAEIQYSCHVYGVFTSWIDLTQHVQSLGNGGFSLNRYSTLPMP
jgi:hypothetical protein